MRIGRQLRVTEEERSALEALIRAGSTPQNLADRCRIVLASADGRSLAAIARELGTWPQRVSRWRDRWLKTSPEDTIANRLADEPRPGSPGKFTAEQHCSIIALACEPPENCGLPFTHWSAPDLAREAVKRGIVEEISPRTVGRFFKRIRP